MPRPIPPGSFRLRTSTGGPSIEVMGPSSSGNFRLCVEYNADMIDLHVNRSQFAALHAAMGELLAFYRNEAPG